MLHGPRVLKATSRQIERGTRKRGGTRRLRTFCGRFRIRSKFPFGRGGRPRRGATSAWYRPARHENQCVAFSAMLHSISMRLFSLHSVCQTGRCHQKWHMNLLYMYLRLVSRYGSVLGSIWFVRREYRRPYVQVRVHLLDCVHLLTVHRLRWVLFGLIGDLYNSGSQIFMYEFGRDCVGKTYLRYIQAMN